MFSSQPYPPMIAWATTDTHNTIPGNILPTATVNVPQQYTPNDVADYLGNMGFTRLHTATGDVWQRTGMNGYMTWEQAVVYCLVKPWLADSNNDGVQTNA